MKYLELESLIVGERYVCELYGGTIEILTYTDHQWFVNYDGQQLTCNGDVRYVFKSERDIKMIFFDPHPGLLGCTQRIPEEVRLLAEELTKTETTLEDAINQIRKACPAGTVYAKDGMIVLCVGNIGVANVPQFSWRVVRYKQSSEKQ